MIAPTEPLAAFVRMVESYHYYCEVESYTYDPPYGDRGNMADAIDYLAFGVIASWYGVDATVAIMGWLWHDVHNMHDGLDVEQAENDVELGLIALGREQSR